VSRSDLSRKVLVLLLMAEKEAASMLKRQTEISKPIWIALSCSEPPEGFARWSLRLLADKVVELDYIGSISHEAVRRVLKKTKSNLGNTRGG